MLQAILGRIRVPRRAKLELDGSGSDLTVAFEAEHSDGRKLNFRKTYPGLLLPVQLVTDLKEWMQWTAKEFFGRPDGGL